MNRNSRLQLAGAVAFALASVSSAFGQAAPASLPPPPTASTTESATTATPNPDQVVKMQAYVVNGQEASLASAQQIKEESDTIVDSIVASDIDKLPDVNAAYALERITGVQVAHVFAGLGGNGAVTIDGLTQIENTIDGREVFTAGGTSGGGVGNGQRTFSYSDIASSLIAGIDVYKSAAADQLEGGLGGIVDVRLHKPFDFDGPEVALTLGTTYSSLQNEDKPNYNLLLADSMKTSVGKVGILVDATYQVQPWREDNIGIGNPIVAPTAVTGDPNAVIASGYTQTSYGGVFQTTGVNTVLQWQPGPNLNLYAGYNFEEWWNRENQEELAFGFSAANVVPGSATLFPGSNTAVESATFANATASTFGIIRDLTDRSRQYYVGGTWTNQGNLTIKTDLSRYDTANGFYNNGILAAVSAPSVTYTLGSTIPSAVVNGASLYDSSRYTLSQIYNRLDPSTGYETAGTVDAEYKLTGSFLTAIDAGFRYAGTEDDNGLTGLYLGAYNFPATANLPSEHPSSLFGPAPVQNFFSGYHEPEVTQYLAGSTASLRNDFATQQAFGNPNPTPSADASASTTGATTMVNPLSLFHIDEATEAVYLMPKFAGTLAGMDFDGNFGGRLVQTNEDLGGFQTVTPAALSSTGTAVLGPLAIKNKYTDFLPSLNFRLKLMPETFLRIAASKTLTRPNFSSMSPSLTLNENPVTPSSNSGAQGNPFLHPMHAENLNITLEKYFNKDTSVYVGGLYKGVTNFIAPFSQNQTYGGVTYAVSTSINLNPARIRGLEAGYQQFFHFLPEPFDGLGVQANLTYLQSTTPSSIAGFNIPLTNLSRTSYNLVGMYEKGPFSARVAYNWRSKYVTGVSNFTNIGLVPQFVSKYGDWDASLNYNLTKQIELTVQGVNLTNTLRYQYWNNPDTPSNDYLDGISLMASVTYKY